MNILRIVIGGISIGLGAIVLRIFSLDPIIGIVFGYIIGCLHGLWFFSEKH